MSDVFSGLLSYILKQVSHLSWELAKLASLASQLASGNPCLCIPGAGTTGRLPFMWVLRTKTLVFVLVQQPLHPQLYPPQ